MSSLVDINDELNLKDVIDFFKRQYKKIIFIFIICFGIVCLYTFTRPTLYKSKAELLIGLNFYFSPNISTPNISTPNTIEPLEQIKYLYSINNTSIVPIKNTAIIQIIAINQNSFEAENAVKNTIDQIIKKHKQLQNQKLEQAIEILKISNTDSKKDIVGLIDRASSSNSTQQIGPISTLTLLYSGIVKKSLGLGFIVSLVIALLLAIFIDRIKSIKKYFF